MYLCFTKAVKRRAKIKIMKKVSKFNVNPAQVDYAKKHIIDCVLKGEVGVATMGLYTKYNARTANFAVRLLLETGLITISSPSTGYRITKSTEYGVSQALKSKNFDIFLAKTPGPLYNSAS